MIHLCLLAAGSGRRFGGNKLLTELQGYPVWRYGYEVLKEVSDKTGASLHVVTRYPEILKEVGKAGVNCPESEQGLSYTVKAAVRVCGEVRAEDAVLFLAADQPRICAGTVEKILKIRLASAPESAGPIAACAWDGENTGNPVLFAGFLAAKLMELTGDKGGKVILRNVPDRVEKVLCDPCELWDIDFPADMEKLRT